MTTTSSSGLATMPDYSAMVKRIVADLERMIFGQLDDAAGDEALEKEAREQLVEGLLPDAFPPRH
jgi:hypothetical protein